MARFKGTFDITTGEVVREQFTAEEEAEADAAELAQLNDPARLLREADAQARADARADNIVQYLRDHTPAECEQYVQDNVTDLASAKAFLRKVAIVLCALSKGSLR